LIRFHTLLHRVSREVDERGRIVATLEDYRMVRSLISNLISEVAEATVPKIVRETVHMVERLLEQTEHTSLNIRQIGSALELEYGPTYRRVKMAEETGYLTNLEDKRGKPARLILGDPMPRDIDILPRPEDLEDESVFTYSTFPEG
jgi:hypothetical protein